MNVLFTGCLLQDAGDRDRHQRSLQLTCFHYEEPVISNRDPAEERYNGDLLAERTKWPSLCTQFILWGAGRWGEGQKDVAFSARQRELIVELKKSWSKFS